MKSKQERQDTAKSLTEARSKRSPRDQWKYLDKKLGVLNGSRKERKRLLKEMGAPVCEHCEGEGCDECHQFGYEIGFFYE